MTPLISLCMIVKDEAAILDRCLSSVSSFVDEIIIVDTGSTDGTQAIALAHNAKVFNVKWTQDFAAARNSSLAKATGRWIMMLDADEYLAEGIKECKTWLASLDYKVPTGIILPINNFVGQEGSGKISQSKAIRLFTRHPDLQFERPIHEQLRSRSGQLQELEYDLPIYHSGYTTNMIETKQKSQRNEMIFTAMRERGEYTPYDAFTMGNECYVQDLYEKALSYYEEADQPSEANKTWLPICLGSMSLCLTRLERFTDAYQVIQRGKRLWPEYCDFHWLEGHLYAQLGLDQAAIESLGHSLKLAEAGTSSRPGYLISPNYGTVLPLQQLSTLHLKYFDYAKAVTYLAKLCYASPNQQASLFELVRVMSRSEKTEQISSFVRSLYPQPQAHQEEMILDVYTQLGLSDLARAQWDHIHLKGLVTPLLKLQYALLIDQPSLGLEAVETYTTEESVSWKTAILRASLQWPEETNQHILKVSLERYQDNPQLIASVCLQLYREGRYELYDHILAKQEDSLFIPLANYLGNLLFEDQQIELSLDYFSMLLQRDALDGKGYEQVSRLYLMQGEVEEGLSFTEQAISLLPERMDLYIRYLLHSEASHSRTKVSDQLLRRHPGLLHFPQIAF